MYLNINKIELGEEIYFSAYSVITSSEATTLRHWASCFFCPAVSFPVVTRNHFLWANSSGASTAGGEGSTLSRSSCPVRVNASSQISQ